MSRECKGALAAVIACVITLAAPPTIGEGLSPEESGQILRAVHVGSDEEGHPVVTLETDGQVEYESFVLDSPDRLVLDLPGVRSQVDRYSNGVGRDGVERVRAGQHQTDPNPVTRVVFDLDGPVPYEIHRKGSSLVVGFGQGIASPAPSTAVSSAGRPAASSATTQNAEEPENAPTLEDVLAEMDWVYPAGSAAATPAVAKIAPRPTAPPAKTPRSEPTRAEPAANTKSAPSGSSVTPDEIDQLLRSPNLATPQEPSTSSKIVSSPERFRTQTIVTGGSVYSGKRISLNLVDADIKQVFRLFHEISGLNFVLDPDVSGRVTIVLDQVPWDQALDLILKNNGLDKVLEGNVLRIASTRKLAQEAAARKQLKEAEQLEVEPITLTRTLSYAKAADVQAVIREGGILSPRGKVIVDERTNTLIMSDIPTKVDPLDTLISTLDAETPQVLIEARIVETSRNFSQDLGIVWGFQAKADSSTGTQTGTSFPANASVRYGLNLPGQQASILGFSLGNVVDSFTLDLELNALETDGRGRILSSPKIATQNNERAEIEQGVRIPIVNTTATEINVEFVSASLKMVVTPQITAESTVILDVVVENNSPDFVNTAGGIPSIRTQRAQTKVLINDGGTTVIGGIFVVNEGVAEIGVPWFRKIPVFGWLFRNQEITEENRELLIFITPKIIKLN